MIFDFKNPHIRGERGMLSIKNIIIGIFLTCTITEGFTIFKLNDKLNQLQEDNDFLEQCFYYVRKTVLNNQHRCSLSALYHTHFILSRFFLTSFLNIEFISWFSDA